jgi:hypothetical protein
MTDTRSRVRLVLMAAGLVMAVGAWASVAACSSGGGKTKPDAAGDGISFDWRFGDLPPGCPPAAGNEKNVGKICSHGGKECPSGLICACESYAGITPPEDTPCVCTIPILGRTCDDPMIPAGYCGTGATCCGYQNIGSLCVPDVCLPAGMCPMF